MKKIVILVLIGVALFACTKENGQKNAEFTLNESDLAALNKALESEPLVGELLSIQQNFSGRIIKGLKNKDFTFDELKNAYKERNFEKVQSFMSLTDVELNNISWRLNEISSQLMDKYPLLAEYVSAKKSDCIDCSIDTFFDNYENFLNGIPSDLNVSESEGPQQESDEPVDCQYLAYTAALIICAKGAAVPLVAGLCVYLATCRFCSGGWVDTVCEN